MNAYETKEEIAEVVLKYTVNEGKKWKRIITIKEDNPGTCLWTIPNVTKTKKKCKVKVQLKDKNGNRLGTDASDSYFTIKP